VPSGEAPTQCIGIGGGTCGVEGICIGIFIIGIVLMVMMLWTTLLMVFMAKRRGGVGGL
jgi:hypothetical protein